MADKTSIEWTDATWNPIRGCSRVSDGCRNCYAEVQAARIIAMDRGRGVPEGKGAYDGLLAKGGQWNGSIKVVESAIEQPLRWQKPRRIFVNSMSDLFHPSVPTKVIDRVFAVMALAERHTFQVLTKRPDRMQVYLNTPNRQGIIKGSAWELLGHKPELSSSGMTARWPLKNVWLGVSIENQAAADERIQLLLESPAAVRWLSMEPLLGPVALPRVDFHCDVCGGTGILGRFPTGNCTRCQRGSIPAISTDPRLGMPSTPMRRINWVVVGGESGLNARPMHPEWATALRDQCAATGVPFLFKQWGEWVPRSSCYHTFADGKSCGDYDPTCERWPVIRLTYLGHDGRQLGSDTSGGSEAYMQRVGKKFAGRLLDGEQHDGYPEARP